MIADPAQLEQIILNLSFNARDAMPSGGELRLSTSIETVESPREVGLDRLPAGRYATLEVQDTGSGIAPAILDKIFEPFFTTKPRDRGTGLGLSTVYGLARQLGGAIEVSSTLGQGSSFRVWLPYAAAFTEEEGSGAEASVWPAAASSTILFVDDDDEVRTLAARLLAKGGHHVLLAANAGEALLITEKQGKSIDLLVTDTIMPFMDGRALAERVLQAVPTMGVLFISGHPSPCADEGEERFLAKPFTESQLARAVSLALGAASNKINKP